MTAFILKSGICMFLLFGLYWLLLRKEKLFIFNRYYLIFSVLFSLTLPFFSFSPNIGYNTTTSHILTALNHPPGLNPVKNELVFPTQTAIISGNSESQPPAQSEAVKTRTVDIRKVLLVIYLAGFSLMLIRFCRNISQLNRMLRSSDVIDHQWYRIVLLNRPVSPFSFLHKVFMNKLDYLENRIAANVIRHELEHVRQAHSLDVIFFEIIHIIFWFNPVIFLYKWAARINHEYLADEAVIVKVADMKSYAGELINFISHPVSMPFTSGLSTSMIKLRLLMLNTNTSTFRKNIRMVITIFLSVLLMGILSIRPAYPGSQDSKTKNDSNKDIVIEEVYFKDLEFNPLKALFVIDGRKLRGDEMITIDLKQIKTIDILKGHKAIRKYGRDGKNGTVEMTTYKTGNKSVPDSLYFKSIYTVNDKVPEGRIAIPASNLFSLSIWTYPIFPNQDLKKRWRTIGIMTRDFYTIRGRVIQQNGEPLYGVQVRAGNHSGITDNNGNFLIEDLKPDVMAELSAAGYEPLKFKVSDKVFKSELNITLDKKQETEQKYIPMNKTIRDFSGSWQVNQDLSTLPRSTSGKGTVNYKIHQYDSDSIMMDLSIATENQKVYNGIRWCVFNSSKSETDENDAIKSLSSCSINPDGRSFSVITQLRSLIGLFRDYKTTETFSLSADGKQMTIRTIYIPDVTSGTNGGVEELVFDKSE